MMDFKNMANAVDKSKFDVDMTKYINVIGDFKKEVLDTVVREAYTQIITNDSLSARGHPAHLSGSYMASHRIGVDVKDDTYSTYEEDNSISLEAAKAEALLQLNKLEAINKDTNTVTISNSVQSPRGYAYAFRVEYKGWANKGPYYIYERATTYIKGRMDSIIKKVRKKYLK